jgi:hypothetical protein
LSAFQPPKADILVPKPGQECPPKKEKEKTKEKDACAPDLPDEGQSGDQRRGTEHAECPVRTLMLITTEETEKIEGWNLWLAQNGFPPLAALPVQGRDASRPGFLMPRRWVPSEPEVQDKVRCYLAWAMEQAGLAATRTDRMTSIKRRVQG